MSPVSQYIADIQKTLKTGDAREHAYRPALQRLIETIDPNIQAINEPAYTGGNAPDFLFKRGEVPVSYAECKDVTVDISDREVQKQADRYIKAFGKILLTNYIEFRVLDESGEVARFSIATRTGNELIVDNRNFEQFENLIRDYLTPSVRTIRSARKLAEIMAGKARLLRDNSLAALNENASSDIYEQYKVFKQVLIKDLTLEEFSDMYAQTLVYGLFVARYFDDSLEDFSRHEAHDLLPSTNPLLKKFFGHVAGTDFDPKVAWMVDSLIEAYKSADLKELMHKEFEKKHKDPILHFYETFLTEYDQDLRKSRGVYYTPAPVVSFIVRSVDLLLKNKFNLTDGLSDISKVEHEFTAQAIDGRTSDGRKKIREQIHKIQILDPAVGTGTFLNEVVHEIHKSFENQEGRWPSYVENELLPRLHGFELMMASYTMAHLKLGITLRELGYRGLKQRLSVWLTNSLEASVHEVPNLFMSQWLTAESNQASRIKSEMPIMVVIGNPPYSASSSNKSKHIQSLIAVYKKDLNEQKINLDDDYIKFIRFAEHAVERTGYGIVAMITNNSFLDGITHRQMRKHLLETFDEVYVLDLHGNTKKKEKTPTGEKDENVFNIQQGVSISIFVKNDANKNGLGSVYFSELWGSKEKKYSSLNETSIVGMTQKEIEIRPPNYFFTPKDFSLQEEYDKGFSITDLFGEYNSGIQTKRDLLTIAFTKQELEEKIEDILSLSTEEVRVKYKLPPDGRDWSIEWAKKDLRSGYEVLPILYRPFDMRWTAYTTRSKGFIAYPRHKINQHIVGKSNLTLLTTRTIPSNHKFDRVFATRNIADIHVVSDQTYVFPLYLFDQNTNKQTENLSVDIISKFKKILSKEPSAEDLFSYVYGILNSEIYREKYKTFLRIDFPRIPYPLDFNDFEKTSSYGKELLNLHTLVNSRPSTSSTSFPESGSDVVESRYPKFEANKVWINEHQYFGNVPESAWFYSIGGYPIAKKWLQSRVGRKLSNSDILDYQKVINCLIEMEKVSVVFNKL